MGGPRRIPGLLALALLVGALAPAAPVASAQDPDPLLADSLAALDGLVAADVCVLDDAADDDPEPTAELGYRYCDDGVVPSGGGSKGVPVPVKYAADASGDDHTGLPAPATQDEVDAADVERDLQPETGNRITLDVNVSLPPEGLAPPSTAGYPVIVFMHGCCGGNRTSWEAKTVDEAGERWHHSNAWFASRGYVVVNYTARGFRNNMDQGSTGTTQLQSRSYEMNDFQYVVGLMADHDAAADTAGESRTFNINPKKIAAVGGSYGGGFSWLALTDPTWRSPIAKRSMKLAAVVPKYGWTDLVESLVPSGHYRDRKLGTKRTVIAPTDVAKAPSRTPIGVEKQSIVSGLYATGNLASGNHTTFPQWLHETYARLQQGEPYNGDTTIETAAERFLHERSAYYQKSFWTRVSKGLRIPVFSAATWTDPLFPTLEHMRFYNKLVSIAPSYPITTYLGDYQHFTPNKPKEWGDICGEDHHVCTIDDYRNGDRLNLNKTSTRVRVGINTRINRFLDHWLKGKGKQPRNDVTGTTTICASNATEKFPVDEPGIEYRAPTWRKLTEASHSYKWSGGGAAVTTTSSAANDTRAPEDDPVARDRTSDKCFTTSVTQPPPGVVQYISNETKEAFTFMGVPTVTTEYATSATDYWIAVRVFDLAPGGSMTMVSRGICKVDTAAFPDEKCSTFDLFGNGWRFEEKHRVVVEVTQADTPFLRRSNFPSTIQFTAFSLDLPVVIEDYRHDAR